MTTKNCANGPKLVLKDLCEKSFVRYVRLPCGILMIKILVLFCKCNDMWNTLNCAPYLVYKNKHLAEAYPYFFVMYISLVLCLTWIATCFLPLKIIQNSKYNQGFSDPCFTGFKVCV